MIGWFMTAKRIRTKDGKAMKFLSLEDLTDTFEAVLFPETYAKYAEKTMSFGPYLVEGKVDALNGNNLIVNKLEIIGGELDMELLQSATYSESNYNGENEKVYEEETQITLDLDKEKLIRAYAG